MADLPTLYLALKAEYFDAIQAGTKPEEFRLVTPYWRKRLEGREYSRIVLTKGYPAAEDAERRLTLPWRGYTIKTITHPHFGAHPVEVFAIKVADGVRAAPAPDLHAAIMNLPCVVPSNRANSSAVAYQQGHRDARHAAAELVAAAGVPEAFKPDWTNYEQGRKDGRAEVLEDVPSASEWLRLKAPEQFAEWAAGNAKTSTVDWMAGWEACRAVLAAAGVDLPDGGQR